MVRCRDGSLYAGWTNSLEERIASHNSGKGAKYTRNRGPVLLAYKKEFDTKSEAMSHEYFLKRLKKSEKEALVSIYLAREVKTNYHCQGS